MENDELRMILESIQLTIGVIATVSLGAMCYVVYRNDDDIYESLGLSND